MKSLRKDNFDLCSCGRCIPWTPLKRQRVAAHPDAAPPPAYGSVHKIQRVGDRAARLIQRGGRKARYEAQQLDPVGELLQRHQTDDFNVALSIFAALVSGEAVTR